MAERSQAIRSLLKGAKYPYDAPDGTSGGEGPPAADWAHAAARGILYDLNDRRGIRDGFHRVGAEARAEIVSDLADIIRVAKELEDD